MNAFGIYEVLIVSFLLIFISMFIIWLRALFEILKSDFTGNNKIIWLLAVVLVPFIGAIAYFTIGRKQKTTRQGLA